MATPMRREPTSRPSTRVNVRSEPAVGRNGTPRLYVGHKGVICSTTFTAWFGDRSALKADEITAGDRWPTQARLWLEWGNSTAGRVACPLHAASITPGEA